MPFPVPLCRAKRLGRHRLHHLAENRIGENNDGVPVMVRKVKRLVRQLKELLGGGRAEHQALVVTVPAAAGTEPVIGLGGGDPAEPGACPGHAYDHGGQLSRRQRREAFAQQREPRPGGGGHAAGAGGGRTEHHVDAGQFALALEKSAPGRRQVLGHVLEELVLGCDRVAEKKLAPGPDGALADGLVAPHQCYFAGICHRNPLMLISPRRPAFFEAPPWNSPARHDK